MLQFYYVDLSARKNLDKSFKFWLKFETNASRDYSGELMTELFKEHCSDFLFARPSLLGGISRVLDLGGTLKTYNYSTSQEMADLLATSQDWRAVGISLREALEEYRKTQIDK